MAGFESFIILPYFQSCVSPPPPLCLLAIRMLIVEAMSSQLPALADEPHLPAMMNSCPSGIVCQNKLPSVFIFGQGILSQQQQKK